MNYSAQFNSHVMFCNSTGNNTVNLIPALQLGIKKVFIISTEHTEMVLTPALVKIMRDYKIAAERKVIEKDIEKDVILLTDRLSDASRDIKKIVWNITGGQKIPILAFNMAFNNRINNGFEDDVMLYTEASPPEIWFFGSEYKTEHIRSDANISLTSLLLLYGSEIVKHDKLYPEPSDDVLRNIQTGRLALKYFMKNEWFREVFFNSMKPNEAYTKKREEIIELIKHALNDVKPKLSELGLTSVGYENFVNEMNILAERIRTGLFEEAQKIARRLIILGKPSEIYNDYWNSIKKRVVDGVLENIKHKREKLMQAAVDEVQKRNIISSIRSIGGEIEDFRGNFFYKNDLKKLSAFRPGILFEWMVASYIIDVIQHNEKIRNNIVSIHMGVKTKKAEAPDSQIDTDIDITISTKFGTLLFLEMKAHEFSGDIVKSKESTAYKKSGPYGKAIMVGPLLKSMVMVKENEEKVYPSYIDGKIRVQEETAKQNNVQYVYIDGIEEMLKKELFCK